MTATGVEFTSGGVRLEGDIRLPPRPAGDGAVPAVIAICGYTGIRAAHPARFARALVPRGWAVLGFDYRGSGTSDGERGRIIPAEQVEDVHAAVRFLADAPGIDSTRIGLLGWGLGGGVAIAAAAEEPLVAAVVACNPIGDGGRALRFMHRGDLAALEGAIAADRGRRARGEPSLAVPAFSIANPQPGTRAYFEEARRDDDTFVQSVTLESAEALLAFRPEETVERVAPRPLLLVHGA
ncbi:MAG: alpha/beta fold hydrolase, partial [Actinobacteria bacterium]|nr:alpha/beta fold hydrolase [Actinomycetota bacterium]